MPGNLARWRREQTRIYDNVMSLGVADGAPALCRAYEDPSPDASNLLAVGTGFLPPKHPSLAATVDATARSLARDGLLYRYLADDGLPGREGCFLPCSFWWAEALARIGRVDEAARVFERALAYANPLQLLPEEIYPESGAYLGNYPQALSHIALINAALAINERANREFPNAAS